MKQIAEEVNKIIINIFKKQHPILGEIIVNWPKIVGINFCLKSVPLKITTAKYGDKKINTLYVTAKDSSISMEIYYQQEIILERLAVYLGYRGINKLKVLVR